MILSFVTSKKVLNPIFLISLIVLSLTNISYSQLADMERKYSKTELKLDLSFIKKQIFDVHAYPWSELNKGQYEKLFDNIENKIDDSLLLIDYYKLVKPVVSFLSDEHSEITLPKNNAIFNDQNFFLPFTIKITGNYVVIDTILDDNKFIHKGDTLQSIDGEKINDIIGNLINYSTGYPGQRKAKSLQYFGYWYPIGYKLKDSYTVQLNDRVISIKPIKGQVWNNYIHNLNVTKRECKNSIVYKKYGNIGYIKSCSFNAKSATDLQNIDKEINEIFEQIKMDKVDKIIIDVSQNSGGNSVVGDKLINCFYNKSYTSYQCYWKRSDEYLQLLKSWGINDDQYQKVKVGETIHSDPDEVKPANYANRFQGKVYILIGNGTFSSAIMFSTLVKDNGIGTLIGQTPLNGHPNHFGEMYNCKTPITNLEIRFGVKRWIRPSGVKENNVLEPDITINEPQPFDIEKVIKYLPK